MGVQYVVTDVPPRKEPAFKHKSWWKPASELAMWCASTSVYPTMLTKQNPGGSGGTTRGGICCLTDEGRESAGAARG